MKPWSKVQLEGRILYEDDQLLAVDKWPDLPTTGRTLDDEDCLQWKLIQRHGSMVWSAHQLDADTSGVCIFTKSKDLVEPLKQAMSSAASAKVYRAFVRGLSDWDLKVCEAPIGYIDHRNLGVTEDGKSAKTQITVVSRFANVAPAVPDDGPSPPELAPEPFPEEGASEWLVRIETGRTHQIRIHASFLGHPLLGEEWYRSSKCTVHPRQALHAEYLQLGAPFNRTVMAPIPKDIVKLRARLRGRYRTSS